jgi:negative regulator of genetic competence, sporulation and motility
MDLYSRVRGRQWFGETTSIFRAENLYHNFEDHKDIIQVSTTVETSNLTVNLLAMKGIFLISVSYKEYGICTLSVKTVPEHADTQR